MDSHTALKLAYLEHGHDDMSDMNNKLCEYCGNKKARIRFCSNKCKDKYHNTRNPRGFFRHLAGSNSENEHDVAMSATEDGWDGHKNSF